MTPGIRGKKKSKARLHTQPPEKAFRSTTSTVAHTYPSHTSSSSKSSSMTRLPAFNTLSVNRRSIVADKSSSAKEPSRSTNEKTPDSIKSDDKLLEIDSRIHGHYEIHERLGKGAYGIVWKAEKRTGEKVALKKIFDAFRNRTDAQRTYREVHFLLHFGCHPNIIKLLNAHRAKNNLDLYLVFPLLDSDLHKVIKEGIVLKETTIQKIFYQILKAVKFLHSAEVIHRDLKPANILLDKYYNVKVADFGLARSLANIDPQEFDNQHQMTEYVATRWYRPPEILLACRKYHKGVDLWGLGCILSEILLGKAVFAGSSTLEQLQIIMSSITEPSSVEIRDLCGTQANVALIEAAIAEKKTPLTNLLAGCCSDGAELAEKFLTFHPSHRINVDMAIAHRFLAKIRKESEELTCYPTSPPLNDNVQLPLEKYRLAIYDVIQNRNRNPHTGVQSSRSVLCTPSRPENPKNVIALQKVVRPGSKQNNVIPKDDMSNLHETKNRNNILKKTQSSVTISMNLNQFPEVEQYYPAKEQENNWFQMAVEDESQNYRTKTPKHDVYHWKSDAERTDGRSLGSETEQQQHNVIQYMKQMRMDTRASDLDRIDSNDDIEILQENGNGVNSINQEPTKKYNEYYYEAPFEPKQANDESEDLYDIRTDDEEFYAALGMVGYSKVPKLPALQHRSVQNVSQSNQRLKQPQIIKQFEDKGSRPYYSRSKEKIERPQELLAPTKVRDISDWHFQEIRRGKGFDQSYRNQPKQTLASQKARTSAFQYPEEDKRASYSSSYFPNNFNRPLNYNQRKQCQTQQLTEVKPQRRGNYDTYTQTHGTISASDLSELRNISAQKSLQNK